MKKIVLALILLIIASGIVMCACTNEPEHNVYPRAAFVNEIKLKDDIVVFEDGAGFAWECQTIEDWVVGDVVAMLMDDNGTPNSIYDDYIIAVEYGW